MGFEEVADLLGVSYDPMDQDWDITAAYPELIPQVGALLASRLDQISENDRGILLHMALAALDCCYTEDPEELRVQELARMVEGLLRRHWPESRAVLLYWAAFDDSVGADRGGGDTETVGRGFPVTPFVRTLLRELTLSDS